MKQNKRAIMAIFLVLAIAIATTFFFVLSNRCVPDGSNVCYDKESKMFQIEKDAKVSVQVESEAIGEKLISVWNEAHPDFPGVVSYTVAQPLDTTKLQEPFTTDIIITKQNSAAFFLDRFQDMGRKVDSVLGSDIPNQLQDQINLKGNFFVPNTVKGPVFAYNETLMKELGFSLDDLDESGLPDVFESWQLIMQAQPKIMEKLDVLFPLTFEDQTSFYPFLTGGRWTLNYTKNGSDPGFDTREFNEGLKFIASLSATVFDKTTASEVIAPETTPQNNGVVAEADKDKVPVQDGGNEDKTSAESAAEAPEKPKVYKNKAESLKWQYEKAFFNRKSLFTIVNDFEMASAYEASTNDKYVYAPFPSNATHHLSPMAEVEGYAMRKDISFPSASAEVMRLLRSGPIVSNYFNETGKIPVFHRNSFSHLNIDNQKVLQRMRAYNFSDTPPVMALDKNPNVLSRKLYTEIDIMPALRELYNGTKSVDETQAVINALAQAWLLTNNGITGE